jgi:nitrous oxidase accessory protein NosD
MLWDFEGEGNYWSDYEERYLNATEIDGTDILDTPLRD